MKDDHTSNPPTHVSNLTKVREIVEREGDDFVQRRDEEGHTFVHWAALGGANDVLEYLTDRGAPLNEHSLNDYGPRPIHWACVHGHVVTMDLLLDKGVPVDTLDTNGCSPLMISAQYGQSLCISYLLQKGANKFQVDVNGDSALHWAAFKGMLVYSSVSYYLNLLKEKHQICLIVHIVPLVVTNVSILLGSLSTSHLLKCTAYMTILSSA